MTKKMDIPNLVELLKQKQHRIIMEVADGHFGGSVPLIADELRRRLDGTGVSSADVAEWARLISEGRAPVRPGPQDAVDHR